MRRERALEEPRQPAPVGAWGVVCAVLLAAALLAFFALGARLWLVDPEPGVVCLELTFGNARVDEVVGRWDAVERRQVEASIRLDYRFIPAYVLVWLLLTRLALGVLDPPPRRRRLLQWAPVAAGLLDVLENLGLLALLSGSRQLALAEATSAAALGKFLLLSLGPIVWIYALWRRWLTEQSDEALLKRSERESFDDVRAAELDLVRRARQSQGSDPDAPLVGLALSGGGIRSATFNLGLLQALSRLGLLERIDYLSSVSGGGYIASWLTKWVRNSRQGIRDVARGLSIDPRRSGQEPSNVGFLRAYSNYLTPRVGFLSADTWTSVATYVRNFLLNLLILATAGFLVLLVPRMMAALLSAFDQACPECPAAWWPRFHFVLGFALATVAIRNIGVNLVLADRERKSPVEEGTLRRLASQTAVQLGIVAPLVASALFFSYWLHRDPEFGVLETRLPPLAVWILLTSAAYTGAWVTTGWFANRFRRRIGQRGRIYFWTDSTTLLVRTAPFVGALGGAALWALARTMPDWSLWLLVTFGPPAVMMLFTLVAVLQIGLMGRGFDDYLREWLARVGAWINIYSLAWATVFGLAHFAPVLIAHAGSWVTTTLTWGWIASSLAGVLAGRSRSRGTTRAWQGALLRLTPWIFIVGLITALSFGLDALLSRSHPELWERFAGRSAPAGGSSLVYDDGETEVSIARRTAAAGGGFLARVAAHDELLTAQAEEGAFWLLALALAPLLAVLSRRVDINEFSMHQYYRNRLVRCYLGASNPAREPQSFTGLDAEDDEPLGSTSPHRPYPLINTALNLVSGTRLGWQQRKASSFVLAPLYSGFENPPEPGEEPSGGFRQTLWIEGMTLGTAMAISGAAASPNMGFRSTPALSLLLTIFNVRLGWWLGNPKDEATWDRLGPRVALAPLLSELFGLTSEDSSYVYLSDGGHFENLGIYELVRRRCRFIVASDAGADGELAFEDLGNAIRKCRIDFGVDIDIDTSPLSPDEDGRSSRHCVVGKITYPQGTDPADRPELGWLLYIKTTLTGDEPADVLQYARSEDDFPHQSTGDQFFDESQFESYRSLGYHVGRRVFEAASDQVGADFHRWEPLFQDLRERWFTPSSAAAGSFSGHGEALNRLFARLGREPALQFLDAEIYPEWRDFEDQSWDSVELPSGSEKLRAGFYFCNSLIQLMENVYLDLRLDEDYEHPDNKGWINLFRQWVSSPMMQATWAISAATYGARFQTFCRRRLHLEQGRVVVRPADVEAVAGFRGLVEAESREVGRELADRLTTPPAGRRHFWYQLRLELTDSQVGLPVGFCLLETRPGAAGTAAPTRPYLLYFHIHAHLRNTGLAQRGLRGVADFADGLELIEDDERLRAIPAAVWHAFENLYRASV